MVARSKGSERILLAAHIFVEPAFECAFRLAATLTEERELVRASRRNSQRRLTFEQKSFAPAAAPAAAHVSLQDVPQGAPQRDRSPELPHDLPIPDELWDPNRPDELLPELIGRSRLSMTTHLISGEIKSWEVPHDFRYTLRRCDAGRALGGGTRGSRRRMHHGSEHSGVALGEAGGERTMGASTRGWH